MKKIMFAGLLGLLAGCTTQPSTPPMTAAPVPQAMPAPAAVTAQPAPAYAKHTFVIPASRFDLAPDEVVTELRRIGYQAYNEKKTVRVSASLEDFNFIREHIQQISRSIAVVRVGNSKDAHIDLG